MKNQKGFTLIEGLLVVFVVGLIGFAGYYVWSQRKSSSNSVATETEQPAQNEQSGITNFEECDNQAYPVEERNGIEYCTGPDGTEYENSAKESEASGTTKNWENKISFNIPSGWDESDFTVSIYPATESFLAPMGGGGGGLRHIYDADNDRWLDLASNQSTVGEGTVSKHLTQSKFDNLERKVAFGRMSEGGSTTHYFLVTDGNDSYQVILPIIVHENNADADAAIAEQNSLLKSIIRSVKFL